MVLSGRWSGLVCEASSFGRAKQRWRLRNSIHMPALHAVEFRRVADGFVDLQAELVAAEDDVEVADRTRIGGQERDRLIADPLGVAGKVQRFDEFVAELRAWLEQNWDPELTVGEWWERLGLAGWASPTLRLRGRPPVPRRTCGSGRYV